MNTLRNYLLALCVFSALFTIDAAAQRVKPTLPEPATIEAGKFYYLFNEDAELFMEDDQANSDYLKGTSFSTLTFRFIYDENSATYAIKRNDGDYYLRFYSWNSTLIDETTTNPDGDNRFICAQLPNGLYTIQHNYEYNANHYISCPNAYEGGRISATDTLNRKWRLIPADDVEATRMMLYMALESVDSTYCVVPYDEILSTATTQAELLEATKKVRSMKSLTDQYVQQSWSDYKIAFTNDASYPWSWESNNSRFAIPYNWEGEKTRLTAIVEVDVDEAMLHYGAFCSEGHDYVDYGDSYSIWDANVYKQPCELNVFVDGVLLRNVARDQIHNENSYYYPYDTDPFFHERLTKGVHTIEWEYIQNPHDGYDYSYIRGVGVIKMPTVSVSLLEPGSLGSEILTQVNSVLDVRRLKIKGEMNADDWATIKLITKLQSIDLSEAIITEIPDNQFNNHGWLCEVSLPEGLTRIGEYAFYDSYIDDVNFPSTLETIGQYAFANSNIKDALLSHTQLKIVDQYAFSNCRFIEEVTLPEVMNSIGERAFEQNRHMHSLQLPKSITSMGNWAFFHADSLRSTINFPTGILSVPNHAFQYCHSLDTLILPNSVTAVNGFAFDVTGLRHVELSDSLDGIYVYGFSSCRKLKHLELPNSLTRINNYGFAHSGLDSISIPENTTVVGNYAFYDCNDLLYAELPTTYYNIANEYIFSSCDKLEHIKIKSPTVLYGATDKFVSWKNNVTVEVPDYLVNSYKLNTYWYTYKDVIGFGTSEVDTWTINNPVVLDGTSRLQGTPSVVINYTTLTMQGETGMELDNLDMILNTTEGNYYNNGYKYYYNLFSNSSQILSSADIDVKGQLTLDYYTYGNHWAYIALPFDIKVSDIRTDAQFAIRYYDGTSRADSAVATGNWKNYTADDVIPAGTGFIYQTSLTGWTTFVAYENASKSRAFSAKDLSTPLLENPSETSAHRGWNLVGNPWMTWYNIHTVDFTAPITVYDQYNLRYTAYSIIDDDVALHPTQAFFVQCPEDVATINFPARGRQLTSEIKNQNGAPSLHRAAAATGRQLIDLVLSCGDATDRTRVVLNEKAILGYDYGKDASKFFAEDNVMQLYSVADDDICYAINERPESDGVVRLAFISPAESEYTLSLARNQVATVMLTDLATGVETDLTQNDYTFTSDAGTFTDRFLIRMKASTTSVEAQMPSKAIVRVVEGGLQTVGSVVVYSLDGRRIVEGEGFIALDKGVYVVEANGVNSKVVVK